MKDIALGIFTISYLYILDYLETYVL